MQHYFLHHKLQECLLFRFIFAFLYLFLLIFYLEVHGKPPCPVWKKRKTDTRLLAILIDIFLLNFYIRVRGRQPSATLCWHLQNLLANSIHIYVLKSVAIGRIWHSNFISVLLLKSITLKCISLHYLHQVDQMARNRDIFINKEIFIYKGLIKISLYIQQLSTSNRELACCQITCRTCLFLVH